MTRREFESITLDLINGGARKLKKEIDYINKDMTLDSYITTDSIFSDRDIMPEEKINFIYGELEDCFGERFPECFRERFKAAA
ncbi:MAG: hypothetical protein ACYCUW_01685 [bacterium]